MPIIPWTSSSTILQNAPDAASSFAAPRPVMAQPDLFAKRTFADTTGRNTAGFVYWKLPPEIRLEKVQADGTLHTRTRAPAHPAASAPAISAPGSAVSVPSGSPPGTPASSQPPLVALWGEIVGFSEVVLEIKMADNHVDPSAVERARLRRHARQVQRVETSASWPGELPLWLVAPHLPRWLTLQYDLTCFSEGCYRFLRSDFPFVCIAANELPLREELLPFLVARSGKALDELALWAFDRTPLDWMIDMLRSTAVSDPVRDELLERFGPTDDPVVIERTRRMVRVFLRNDAELLRQVTAEVVKEDSDEVRLAEARALLGRLLVRRGLTPTADQQACVDACADLSTLHRWHDQAVTAVSVDEALR